MEEIVYTRPQKGRIIRSVSVTKEDDALITELDLNPSTILRKALEDIRNNSSNWRVKLLQREQTIMKLQEEIQRLNQKIDNLDYEEKERGWQQ